MTHEHFFTCPYCEARISVVVDASDSQQVYVEDCEVCCQPIDLRVQCRQGILVAFEARRSDD